MQRFYPVILVFLSLALQCDKPDQTEHYIFIHNFTEKISRDFFAQGLQGAADSLGVSFSLFHQTQSFPRGVLDSLFQIADGAGYGTPIQQESFLNFVVKVKKKELPLIQFDQPDSTAHPSLLVDTNYYTAGRRAALYMRQIWGENGRYGLVTTTLEDRYSNECIRGFREALAQAKSSWKQINIITCGDRQDEALKQYRHATRFGNRIIWFFIHNCDDFLEQLINLKKDNIFIAIDLHPTENNIKFLVDGYLDAVVSKNFAQMGNQCLLELVQPRSISSESGHIDVNCGSTVFTSESIKTDAYKK
ncbi:substrate-binding domain-containing protein [candidate division KSB1 bacterium]|nr:substrate-binding domain-containing protein [candidate division KSB1 bacterium]